MLASDTNLLNLQQRKAQTMDATTFGALILEMAKKKRLSR